MISEFQYKRQALGWKFPDLLYKEDYRVLNETRNDEIFEWHTDKYKKPTDAEMLEWYEQYKYIEERKYPKIPDQLDALWHDIDDGILGVEAKESKWYKSIKEVKDSNPKGV